MKPGVATPRDLQECGWRGRGGGELGVRWLPITEAAEEVEEEASRKYKNEVVGLRFPSVVPREPRRAPSPEAAAPPLCRVFFVALSARPLLRLLCPRAPSSWSSRSHGAGASVSTMELAAWCRWGLLLALLPPGATGTQGGSGLGRAGSRDGTLQPGTPAEIPGPAG